METSSVYSISLAVFEGPLDLLLHLVRRHELNILEIPISLITEKYLEYLELMRALDLEIAGEYLVMAATLAFLKSRELLPSSPEEEQNVNEEDSPAIDLREQLIARLLEYQQFHAAGQDLDQQLIVGRDVFGRGATLIHSSENPPLAPITLFRLTEAYHRVLARAKIQAQSHEVTLEAVTVRQRMEQLTLVLIREQSFEFDQLFLQRSWASEVQLRSMLVVTLMSILEMVKLGIAQVQKISLEDDEESIRISRVASNDVAMTAIEHYSETESYGTPSQDLTGS